MNTHNYVLYSSIIYTILALLLTSNTNKSQIGKILIALIAVGGYVVYFKHPAMEAIATIIFIIGFVFLFGMWTTSHVVNKLIKATLLLSIIGGVVLLCM